MTALSKEQIPGKADFGTYIIVITKPTDVIERAVLQKILVSS